jgi:MYXO-CTERM domain-containing protein
VEDFDCGDGASCLVLVPNTPATCYELCSPNDSCSDGNCKNVAGDLFVCQSSGGCAIVQPSRDRAPGWGGVIAFLAVLGLAFARRR